MINHLHTTIWSCDECDDQAMRSVDMPDDDEAYRPPATPDGWTQTHKATLCHRCSQRQADALRQKAGLPPW